MSHPSLLDQEPSVTRVRPSDPDTSRAAAESMTPAALRKQQGEVLWALCETERTGHDGATTLEIVLTLAVYRGRAPQQSVAAKRCSELRDKGLIMDTGRTRPGSTSRPLTVWKSTIAGREAAPEGVE